MSCGGFNIRQKLNKRFLINLRINCYYTLKLVHTQEGRPRPLLTRAECRDGRKGIAYADQANDPRGLIDLSRYEA